MQRITVRLIGRIFAHALNFFLFLKNILLLLAGLWIQIFICFYYVCGFVLDRLTILYFLNSYFISIKSK